ncbi:hypothetical protein [Endozoicomonas sp. 2B-B]
MLFFHCAGFADWLFPESGAVPAYNPPDSVAGSRPSAVRRTVLATALVLAAGTASAYNCYKSDVAEYFGISVHNNSDLELHLDLGDPKHGTVDHERNVYITPHTRKDTSVCSDGLFTGVETYIRLYDPDYSYLADWYVKQPYLGQNTIKYHRYTYSGLKCHTIYYYQWTYYNDQGELRWNRSVAESEPHMLFTHRQTINVEVTCDG